MGRNLNFLKETSLKNGSGHSRVLKTYVQTSVCLEIGLNNESNVIYNKK